MCVQTVSRTLRFESGAAQNFIDTPRRSSVHVRALKCNSRREARPLPHGRAVPASVDLGRQFLYACYNAEMSKPWLEARGLGDVDPASVAQLDSVAHIGDLVRVGRALAEEVSPEHFNLERLGQIEGS